VLVLVMEIRVEKETGVGLGLGFETKRYLASTHSSINFLGFIGLLFVSLRVRVNIIILLNDSTDKP
jgi:hypothetical protein